MMDVKAHRPKLVQSHHINLHGNHPVGRFNNWVAMKATNLLSNMWFFWFCVALDLVEGFFLIQQFSIVAFIAYLAQTVIQLLALPLLGASAKLISAAQDARAEADHQTLTAIHQLASDVHSINEQQTVILEEIRGATGSVTPE